MGCALTGLCYAFGPAIFVPTVATINGVLFLGQSDFRVKAVPMAAISLPALMPFGIAALGLGPWPFEITPDRIVIPARLISFPPVMTMIVLAAISFVMSLGPMVLVSTLRRRLRSMEERLFLHSWHLRQLASSGAGGAGGESVGGTGRRSSASIAAR
jgi:hypothetical protein